jgi:cytochrome c
MRRAVVWVGAVLLMAATLAATVPAHAELRGHGGPVRAVAVLDDGVTLVSGSFDQSIIVWDVARGAADRVLRFHEGSVNALLPLPGGRFASGSEDGRVAVWARGASTPTLAVRPHEAAVSALAASADHLYSAGWDGRIVRTPFSGGHTQVLEGHRGPVSGLALAPDGTVYSVGHDATLRVWRADGVETAAFTLPAVPHSLVLLSDGAVAVGGADGVVRVLGPDGTVRSESEPLGAPVSMLRLSPDGLRIAAAGLRGAVTLFNRATLTPALQLVGPGLPVWSLVYHPNGREIVTGGGDRLVRRWNAATGEPIGPAIVSPAADPLAPFRGDRGAEVFRACAACHTLTPDDGNRAGPTLHGVFGRRIATAPGYDFSPALRGMDIVWTAETISRLFEIGPNAYTPGTKMPEQRIGSAEDRAALMRFLEQATRPK